MNETQRLLYNCTHEREDSWWEHDARGIPLCRVCDKCRDIKLSVYRPEVLTNPDYWADEPIDED